jgi:hypothetical protein
VQLLINHYKALHRRSKTAAIAVLERRLLVPNNKKPGVQA